MMPQSPRGGPVIVASFAVALVLTVLPLPAWLDPLRPEWVAMVLIYWCMAVPNRIGVGFAWMAGLLLDVLRGGLLGQHALSLSIVAYITLQLYQRLRVFPPWQQALSVVILIALHLLLQVWITGISGQTVNAWAFMTPALSSMLLWPALFAGLRNLRRRFKIS
jgi:rod shape-determining protein MreD